MKRSRRRINMGPAIQCHAAITDSKGRAKLCDVPGKVSRTVEGVALTYCYKHADEIDAKQSAAPAPSPPTDHDAIDAAARAKWDAKQAKLPPHERRTWEQGLADEEADMGRKLRAARKHGGP